MKGSTLRLVFSSLAAVLTLTACSSDKVVDGANKDRRSELSFINITDRASTFYVQPEAIRKSVFEDKRKAKEVRKMDTYSNYTYKYSKHYTKTDFGVQATQDDKKRKEMRSSLTPDREYWVIGWLDGGDLELSVFQQESSDRSNAFRVRIFSAENSDLYIKDKRITELKRGKVSDYHSVSDCNDDLKIGDTKIDLCDENVGDSYLIAINKDGDYVIARDN